MSPEPLTLDPIGIVRTGFVEKDQAPRQAVVADAGAVIELFPGRNLEHAIEDLADWERIWVIFWFHRNSRWRPKVLPPRSITGRKGVLATRSPHRPNPLGLSAVRLLRIEGLQLHVQGVDMIDGTPVLDIKPYVSYSDAFADSGSGWLEMKDPLPAYAVEFSPAADSQLQWILAQGGPDLRTRAREVLQLGPQPHPYRRIRATADGWVLAIKDWRLHFIEKDRVISVLRATTGYKDPRRTPALHRDFSAANPPATRIEMPIPRN
ncbi:MAG: tRNA (N6-threonylcarbamoyladenosine(37)-N6)-methyltransferase TrmO [Pseudomonadota bacterium]